MVEIQFPNGQSKKVIFTEVQTMDLTDSDKEMVLDQNFDAVCICFEHPNYLKKFMQEKQAFLRYPVPKMALYCKNDERLLDRKAIDVREFSEYGLRTIAECSSRNNEFTSFQTNLFKIIENP